jgi:hypothetical protein
MSERLMWKMLHLLYTLKPGQNGLTPKELLDVGIDCGPDTISPLEDGGAVSYDGSAYALTEPAKTILKTCVVTNRRWSSGDMWVDYPSAFVIMPFNEPWSDIVFRQTIEPGIVGAGLQCIRGDTILRIGDLTQNIWGALLHAGVVVADVSILNANVFYELGLTHALGKDAIILKQAGSKVPADMAGVHYHEYKLQALDEATLWLSSELAQWATDNHSQGVKSIREG